MPKFNNNETIDMLISFFLRGGGWGGVGIEDKTVGSEYSGWPGGAFDMIFFFFF